MTISTNLGYPRIGPNRELKRALEGYWRGKHTQQELIETGKALREQTWRLQQSEGIHHIPSNDFSFYDHVLDTAVMVGAVPSRYGWAGGTVDPDTYFAMARGRQNASNGQDVPAMEMTKWFNTNYHYIVPEFEAEQSFQVASTKPVDEFREAQVLGVHTRPVLLGPVSFLLLGKSVSEDLNPISLLDDLLPVYTEVLRQLADAGASWVQIDEPCLVLDLAEDEVSAYRQAYAHFDTAGNLPDIALTTYFGPLRENMDTALHLPVQAIHLDVLSDPDELDRALETIPADTNLSLGLLDGRNVWRADLEEKIALTEKTVNALGDERVMIGPSTSLLFVPIDTQQEPALDNELLTWLSFAKQKLSEINLITRAVNEGRDVVEDALNENHAAIESRRHSNRIHRDEVTDRVRRISDDMYQRDSEYSERRTQQARELNLPDLPTTSI
ncbi:MAG TPA: 5-methyltetrahydropteroyltriglutamate--homocysteine S-methyltransferase, partial [bacterium]|nr:5-methyltetrahydropteroyltriglutamate--homocysteine S-methyltransferase [bacterium]